MIDDGFGLYLVLTDPVAGYEGATEAAVSCGVRFVQLRMKNAPREQVLATARAMRAITKGTQTLLVVNDDPGIAAEADADGVHVGQDDPPVAEARALCPGRIVGLSTHSLDQVQAANDCAPDYIGVGPVYATPTKQVADPTIHVSGMAAMIRAARVPAVAIGGIDAANLADVLAAGARNFAVVRAVCASADPARAIRNLQTIQSAAVCIS